MKKTRLKDSTRNIKKRIVSFLSLCLVVALGLGVLFTTRYLGAGLEEKFRAYYKDRNFMNFEMMSSLGVSESSLDKIRNVEGVTEVEGSIQADGSIAFGDRKRNVTVISKSSRISVPELVEGNNPTGKTECMIGEDLAEIEGLKVGDKVGISLVGLGTLGDEAPLLEKEFTITGLMHHPNYLRRKAVSAVVLPLEAFNTEATDGLYTRALIRTEVPENISTFSDRYFEETADTKKALEDIEDELGADRTKEIKADANAFIDEEWKKALADMDDAQQQIDDGEAELDSRLKDGRNKLNSAENELARRVAAYRKQIRDGKKKLKQAEDAFNKIEKYLPEIKERVASAKKYYEEEIKAQAERLKSLEERLAEIERMAKGSPEYRQAIAQFISDYEEDIRKLSDFFKREDVMRAAEIIDELTDGKAGAVEAVKKIRAYDVQALIEMANAIASGDDAPFLESVREWLEELKSGLEQYRGYEKRIKEFENNQENYRKQIKDKKKEIKEAEKKLAAEQRRYQAQINAGWSTYYAEKAKYEAKLEEAKLLLEENREEAEKKLQEARGEVENMDPCRWVTLDRKSNTGYVDSRANLNAVRQAGNVFGILFMVVTAIVCMSTLVIIIDEQKTLVGTVKAFGFHKGEILGKYLMFGTLAALAGSVLAVIAGFCLSTIVQPILTDAGLYQTATARTIITPGITALAALVITMISIAASIAACMGILRSPASVLMKGDTLRRNGRVTKKKAEANEKGTLYSRLIMRNMAEDKARVAVTVAIIAFSCMLIGMGISMKISYDAMSDRQRDDIHKFDFRITMNDDVSDEEAAKLASVLGAENTLYLPASTKTMLYRWDGRIDGLQLISADPAKLNDFFAVTDTKTGEPLEIPDDGILIQKRMRESYDMNVGDELPMLDSSLKEGRAEIKGYFANYVGRTVVASPAAYRKIFGKESDTNTYYVILNGADETGLKEKLLAVTNEISFTEKDEFKSKFEAMSFLYNIVVAIITGMAILISFMILTNLSNIFLNRRKTELSVMRVNGFSIKQAKGYLMKETVYTTTAGIVLGVILGAILTPHVIALIQQPDLEFIKSFHTVAWVIAVAIEAVFAVVINSVVFRKVKDLNLRDIA